MASVGALSTLLTMLQAAPTLAGVTVVYGEELIDSGDLALPAVIMVPGDETFTEAQQPGYWQNCDPYLEMLHGLRCNIDFYLQAFAAGTGKFAIDHADAVENLRANVLAALQSQRSLGLFYKPISGRWVKDQNAVDRYGRGNVMTVQVEMTIPDVSPASTEATVITVTETATI